MAEFDSETDGLIAEKEQLAEQVGVLQADLEASLRQRVDSPLPSTALESQLMDVVGVLLPEVEFLRDSRKVILRELRSFKPVFSELRGIATDPAVKGRPSRVRRVEGAPLQHRPEG